VRLFPLVAFYLDRLIFPLPSGGSAVVEFPDSGGTPDCGWKTGSVGTCPEKRKREAGFIRSVGDGS
jgi:hypothetical protein